MAITNSWCDANCPVDCDDTLIVVPEFGCEVPNNEGITEIFYSNDALATGLLSEWNSRLSNSASYTSGTIRSIKDILGDLVRAEAQFKTSRKGASIPLEVDREIVFSLEDDKDSVFEYMSKMQCGLTKRFWFRSGGHIYGGLSGIYGTLIPAYEINTGAERMAHNWETKLKFKSKCFPSRTLAVI